MKPLPAWRKLGVEQLARLCARARAGDTVARNAIVTANMRLVARIATRHANAARRPDLLDDLIQEAIAGTNGRGGLMRAIELFDPKAGRAFSTFAGLWIRKAVLYGLKRRHVAMTPSTIERRAQIRRVADTLWTRNGRQPEASEVLAELRRNGNKRLYTLEIIERAMHWSLEEVQIPQPGVASAEWNARLADPSAPTEDELCDRIDTMREVERLRVAMARLPRRERVLLERRYGRELRGNKRQENAALQHLREIMTGAPTQ